MACNKTYIPDHTCITFSRWSRKGYAVFAGLGKQIRIGVLKIELLLPSLIKQETNIIAETFSDMVPPDTDKEEGSFAENLYAVPYLLITQTRNTASAKNRLSFKLNTLYNKASFSTGSISVKKKPLFFYTNKH